MQTVWVPVVWHSWIWSSWLCDMTFQPNCSNILKPFGHTGRPLVWPLPATPSLGSCLLTFWHCHTLDLFNTGPRDLWQGPIFATTNCTAASHHYVFWIPVILSLLCALALLSAFNITILTICDLAWICGLWIGLVATVLFSVHFSFLGCLLRFSCFLCA